jgi:hypothetical protein
MRAVDTKIVARLITCGDATRADGYQEEGLMLSPGDKAPDFVGRDHTGNPVKLSDF